MHRLLALVLVLVVAAAACGDDDAPVAAGDDGTAADPGDGDGAPATSIEGEYRAVEVTEDGDPRPLVDGTDLDLRFADGQLGANAGCNSIGGAYRFDGDALVVEALSMTEMGCDPERHGQDQWLADLLSDRPMLSTTEDGFVLRAGTTELRFVERSIVEPDVELVGTTWEVDGFLDGDVAMSGVAGFGPGRLVLTEDGFVTGSDGCNSLGYEATDGIGLRYRVEGDQLHFEGSPITTDVACEGRGAEEYQRRFHAVLTGSVAWSIDRDVLTIVTDGDAGVTYRAVDA